MNKKAYIKPELMVEELASEILMFSGSMYDEEVNTEDEGVQLGNGRRGSWGNLWER